MAQMLGFCSEPAESKLLEDLAREIAARLDLPEWEAILLSSLEAFKKKALSAMLPDLCCIDVVPQNALKAAEVIRARSERIKLLLIADPHIPPTAYIRPGIMATSLLLRPFTDIEALTTLTEIMQLLLQDSGESFRLETRQSSMLFAYEQISYFEARERKIWLCAQGRQYPFNDTLENLESTLPKGFIRCHKGYIVNSRHIERVDYTQSIIQLRHGFEIPISRSYKRTVREVCHV